LRCASHASARLPTVAALLGGHLVLHAREQPIPRSLYARARSRGPARDRRQPQERRTGGPRSPLSQRDQSRQSRALAGLHPRHRHPRADRDPAALLGPRVRVRFAQQSAGRTAPPRHRSDHRGPRAQSRTGHRLRRRLAGDRRGGERLRSRRGRGPRPLRRWHGRSHGRGAGRAHRLRTQALRTARQNPLRHHRRGHAAGADGGVAAAPSGQPRPPRTGSCPSSPSTPRSVMS